MGIFKDAVNALTNGSAEKEPPIEEKPEEKPTAEGGESAAKKPRKKKSETYNIYVHKVLKKVSPGTRMTRSGEEVVNRIIHHLFERTHAAAASRTKYNNNKTLTHKDMGAALKLVFPTGSKLVADLAEAGATAVVKLET